MAYVVSDLVSVYCELWNICLTGWINWLKGWLCRNWEITVYEVRVQSVSEICTDDWHWQHQCRPHRHGRQGLSCCTASSHYLYTLVQYNISTVSCRCSASVADGWL